MGGPVHHEPVLVHEVAGFLSTRAGAVVVDATLGLGGHAEKLLESLGADGRLVGIERDPQALELAAARLDRFGKAFLPLRGDHFELQALLEQAEIFAVDAILFDLGVSSLQLDEPARGFSFRLDGPLDMRMDPTQGETAADLLARLSEEELREILWRNGEERKAAAIAHAIVQRQSRKPLTRTGELAGLVAHVIGAAARRYRIHPATRTFQALRIAVNREIEGLGQLVSTAVSLLRRGGRVAWITYHSLEDRAVKHALRALAHRCICPPRLPVCGCGRENLVRLLTPKPVQPSLEEIERNPRSRSAKLRVAERS